MKSQYSILGLDYSISGLIYCLCGLKWKSVQFNTPTIEQDLEEYQFDIPSYEDEIIDFKFVFPTNELNTGINELKCAVYEVTFGKFIFDSMVY
jgi:hypothetical protein